MAYGQPLGGMGSRYGRGNRLAAALAPDHAAISNIKGDTQGLAYALEKGLQGLFAGMDAKEQAEGMKMFADVMTKATAPTTYLEEATGNDVYGMDGAATGADIGMDDLPEEEMETVATPPPSLSSLLQAAGTDNKTFNRMSANIMPQLYAADMARKTADANYLRGRDDKRKDATTLFGRQQKMKLEEERLRLEAAKRKLTTTRETNRLNQIAAHKNRLAQIEQENTNRTNLGSTDQQNYRFVISQIPPGQPKPTFAQYQQRMKLINLGIIPNPNAPAQQPAPPPQQFMQHDNGVDTVGQQVQGVPYAGPMPSQAQGMPAPTPTQALPVAPAQPAYIEVPGGRAALSRENMALRKEAQATRKQQLLVSQQNANKPSSLQQKTYNESVEIIDGGMVAIQSLNEALELSKVAYEGGTAQERAALINKYWPDALTTDSAIQGAEATKLMDNIVQSQALDALKATFGGMPTEGERKILLQIQGSSEQPQSVRDGIWKRAIKLAQEKIDRTRKKARLFEKQYGERYSLGDYGKPSDWGPRAKDTTAPRPGSAPNIPPPPPGARVIGQ